VFGNSLDNPFQKQLILSPLLRLQTTGFNVYELKQTLRFENKPLLDLCALVNELPGLQAVDGSFDDDLSTSYSGIKKMIWRIDSNLIFVNFLDATTVKGVTDSSYSLETACAVMKDAVDRIAHIEGKHPSLSHRTPRRLRYFGGSARALLHKSCHNDSQCWPNALPTSIS
jgi:hypothetical protein